MSERYHDTDNVTRSTLYNQSLHEMFDMIWTRLDLAESLRWVFSNFNVLLC